MGVAGREAGATVHRGGTYICIEGPQFSTRGESEIYRRWGVAVIGMTNMPEAKLAREAELCYATIALATDYDVWHADEEDVNAGLVLQRLRTNAAAAVDTIGRALRSLPSVRSCTCGVSLATALVTAPSAIPAAVRVRLAPILGRP